MQWGARRRRQAARAVSRCSCGTTQPPDVVDVEYRHPERVGGLVPRSCGEMGPVWYRSSSTDRPKVGAVWTGRWPCPA